MISNELPTIIDSDSMFIIEKTAPIAGHSLAIIFMFMTNYALFLKISHLVEDSV